MSEYKVEQSFILQIYFLVPIEHFSFNSNNTFILMMSLLPFISIFGTSDDEKVNFGHMAWLVQ